jgi:peptidylprolyl isomerase
VPCYWVVHGHLEVTAVDQAELVLAFCPLSCCHIPTEVFDMGSDKDLPVVYLDIAIAKRPVGRIEIALRSDIVPRTCENFRCLCTGEKSTSHEKLWFKESIFHRVINQFMMQAGDFLRGDGTGSLSIYGSKFPDEKFTLKHTGPGLLSMANSGPNSNGSQFFITTSETPWLDGKHVVFGSVINGMEVVRQIDAVGSSSGRPMREVMIVDCGQLA